MRLFFAEEMKSAKRARIDRIDDTGAGLNGGEGAKKLRRELEMDS